jgi:uncharacterized protein
MPGDILEEVVTFPCGQAQLWGILSRPPVGIASSNTAVLIAVGGPQYRAGSHRQFVSLGRALAGTGFSALRFDFTGMGDSEGGHRSFDATGPDMQAALDALSRACPQSSRIVVWGLCDAASAALMFTAADARVAGIVAANPWARSEASLAAATVRHYYAARLLQRDFWIKMLRGGLDWHGSLRSLTASLRKARVVRRTGARVGPECFQDAMATGLARLRGCVLLILSGNDLTANEFLEYARSSESWRGLLEDPKITRFELPEADHTFSRRDWLQAVESQTIAWLKRLETLSDQPRGLHRTLRES